MTLRIRVRRSALRIAVLVPLVACVDDAPAPAAARAESTSSAMATQTTAHQRALIVAIAEYAPETGWSTIHSDRDVPLIRTVLAAHHFSDIRELTGPQATRQGIMDAIRGMPAEPGDVIVFHYSGHGQQIPDNNGDELDGYDETLVPYDAPSDRRANGNRDYDGSKHLRDDDFHGLMQELRRRVGPTGNVVAFIDSCFSGTPRGAAPGEAGIRGGAPFGNAQSGRQRGAESGSGLMETAPAGARGGGEGEAGLAPYVVFSAARHDEFAWETKDEKGEPVGSLSYALSLELADLRPPVKTYRDLFQAVSLQIAYRVRNEPQVEGNVDKEIFSDRAVFQEPYLEVKEVPAPDRVRIAAGTLAGLLDGSRAELHAIGAREANPEGGVAPTFLANGEIVDSGLMKADVKLDRVLDQTTLFTSRVFITTHSFGSLRIRVKLQDLAPEVRSKLEPTLQKVSSLEMVEDRPDVVISQEREAPRSIHVRAAADLYPLLPALLPSERDFDDQIGNRLLDYTRNRYLRGVRIEDGNLNVHLTMFPVKVEGCPNPEIDTTGCVVTPLDPGIKKTSGGQEWRSLDYFKLQVKNESSRPAHLSILELAPDGTIAQLWPVPGTSDRTPLAAGDTRELWPFYQLDVYERRGTEMLLLIATTAFLDFEPFVTQETLRDRDKPRGPLGPFAPLFEDGAVRSRARVFIPEDQVGTSSVTFTTCPPEGRPCPCCLGPSCPER